jgi:hypothetical protein
VGLLARQRDTVIGAVTFVQLPLTFLSVALMRRSLLPHWIRTVAVYNPVNWAAEAARSAAMQKINWGLVAIRIGLLTALLLVSAFLATRAFDKYQRSLDYVRRTATPAARLRPFAVDRGVPQPLEHALERVMGLRARHQQALIDHPRGDTAGTDVQCGAGLCLNPVQVTPVPEGIDDLRLVEPDRSPLLRQDPLVAYVPASRPVGVEQARVQLIERAAIPRQLREHQRAARIGDLLERFGVRQPRLLEHRPPAIG